ncbi:MAG: 1-acyl-sn-glycerol-3-phosphate acyltransferase [Gemmataceae bacterium]|nr:1-acyl-sn-glycerol-3-phosphate acyltransferase [Gemmataceae bacterium]
MDDFDLKPARDIGLNPWARLSSVRRESGPFLGAVHTAWAVLARTYFAVWHRLRVIGREHLPAELPFVLCSNHGSHLDALALAAPLRFAVRDRVFALAAGDVFFERAFATAFAAGFINALPVWRKKRTPKALLELREKLVNTPCGFILFPEGGRTRDGNLLPFKPGVGMLVAGTTVPVVPCHISGTFDAMPAGTRFPRPRRITIRVGPAVTFADVPDTHRGWVRVVRVVEERVRALAPGGPAKPPPPPEWADWPGERY